MATSDWWTGGAERTLSETIPAAPDAVRAFYVDLRNIVHVHPLVVSVTPTDRVDVGDDYEQGYRIRDRIPLGPITMTIDYVARVRVSSNGAVRTEARQFPRVRLFGEVSFGAIQEGTVLTERLRITAPRPLLSYTVGQAVAAHQRMLADIGKYFARLP